MGKKVSEMTPEQREKKNARERERYWNMTPEQREKKNARNRKNLTPEQREKMKAKRRERYWNMTPEQREKKRAKDRRYKESLESKAASGMSVQASKKVRDYLIKRANEEFPDLWVITTRDVELFFILEFENGPYSGHDYLRPTNTHATCNERPLYRRADNLLAKMRGTRVAVNTSKKKSHRVELYISRVDVYRRGHFVRTFYRFNKEATGFGKCDRSFDTLAQAQLFKKLALEAFAEGRDPRMIDSFSVILQADACTDDN